MDRCEAKTRFVFSSTRRVRRRRCVSAIQLADKSHKSTSGNILARVSTNWFSRRRHRRSFVRLPQSESERSRGNHVIISLSLFAPIFILFLFLFHPFVRPAFLASSYNFFKYKNINRPKKELLPCVSCVCGCCCCYPPSLKRSQKPHILPFFLLAYFISLLPFWPFRAE